MANQQDVETSEIKQELTRLQKDSLNCTRGTKIRSENEFYIRTIIRAYYLSYIYISTSIDFLNPEKCLFVLKIFRSSQHLSPKLKLAHFDQYIPKKPLFKCKFSISQNVRFSPHLLVWPPFKPS